MFATAKPIERAREAPGGAAPGLGFAPRPTSGLKGPRAARPLPPRAPKSRLCPNQTKTGRHSARVGKRWIYCGWLDVKTETPSCS